MATEKKLGGGLLDVPRPIFFKDGGSNLCLSLDELSPGIFLFGPTPVEFLSLDKEAGVFFSRI